MGATDVLPYPRRRSSIQLEPINFQLPGEVESGSTINKTLLSQLQRFSISDGPQRSPSSPGSLRKLSNDHMSFCNKFHMPSSSGPKSPPILSPLRVEPSRHMLSIEQKRSHSSEGLLRGRSQSLYRLDRALRGSQGRRPSYHNERPHEAGRRRFGSDSDETTAQFIERIRQDLVSQMNRPQELEIIHRRPTLA